MTSIHYLTNASPQSGVGHQATEIARRLKTMPDIALTEWEIQGEQGKLRRDGLEVASVRPWPGMLGNKSVNWVRLGRKINPPPPSLIREEPFSPDKGRKGGVWHFTNQTLSFLAKKLSPSVVTVHDLIELLEPQDWKAQWLNAYLYGGITHANHLICVSEYTKKTVQEHCNIPEEKITVIPNGVGPEFHPIPQFNTTIAWQGLRHELKIPDGGLVVLYVGSDHPRKNVVTALGAFAQVRKDLGVPLTFLKVGAAGLPTGRAALLAEMDRLGVRAATRILDTVSVERLNELYNLADVFVLPSRYEGFGLPALQAMAAGTPVITANATSLSEVVGGAGLMHDPNDTQALAMLLHRVLTDMTLHQELRAKGLVQAAKFSWETAAQSVLHVYQSLV